MKKASRIIAIIIGAAFIILAIMDWLAPTRSNIEHGFAALFLGLLFLLYFWLSGAKKAH